MMKKNLRKKWKNENTDAFKQLISSLSHLENFKSEAIEKLVKDFMEKFSLGFGQVLPILRISITGTMQGPPIFAVMEVLGKTDCLNRLQKGVTLAIELQA